MSYFYGQEYTPQTPFDANYFNQQQQQEQQGSPFDQIDPQNIANAIKMYQSGGAGGMFGAAGQGGFMAGAAPTSGAYGAGASSLAPAGYSAGASSLSPAGYSSGVMSGLEGFSLGGGASGGAAGGGASSGAGSALAAAGPWAALAAVIVGNEYFSGEAGRRDDNFGQSMIDSVSGKNMEMDFEYYGDKVGGVGGEIVESVKYASPHYWYKKLGDIF